MTTPSDQTARVRSFEPKLVLSTRGPEGLDRSRDVDAFRRSGAKYITLTVRDKDKPDHEELLHKVYRITHIDTAGVWGIEVEVQ